MPKISRDEAIDALVSVVKDALIRGDEVHVPYLGTFNVEYHPSETKERPDGTVVMMPPRNEIVFHPEE